MKLIYTLQGLRLTRHRPLILCSDTMTEITKITQLQKHSHILCTNGVCAHTLTHTDYSQITLLNRVFEIQLIPNLEKEVERISQPSQTNFLNMECKH